mgnify:CR=1 FL=1
MKKFLIRFLTKDLFHWVSEEDVFIETKEGITHKRKLLTLEQIDRLREDAISIQSKYLWKVLQNEIRYTAHLHWLKTGEDLSARMLLRAEEIIRKTLDRFAGMGVKKE